MANASDTLKCGIATDNFHASAQGFKTLFNTGKMSFWWNWRTEPSMDTSILTNEELQGMYDTHVPMVWGTGSPKSYDFLQRGTYVMGFNEPDMYGPSCDGDWVPPAYGCSPGEWRAATSSGWAELFDPSIETDGEPRAAQYFQWMVNNMTRLKHSNGVLKIISPSMAGGANLAENCKGVDPSVAGNIKHCQGWLQVFKQNTLKLRCTAFNGTDTNCWDVIDSIQIHAYAHSASSVFKKIEDYYKVFQDDFEGRGGRKKKNLWLTEVACGSNDPKQILPFIDDLMNPSTGLTNRNKYPYLSHVSWFSSYSFDAFTINGIVPRQNESWTSTLFTSPFGRMSEIGQKFFSYC